MTRIAVIGLGSIGSQHVDALLRMGFADLVAVDTRPMPNEDRLPVVGELKEIDGWGTTHALICSPPEWHYHHAKYFLDRGIPTFIEKPMTVSKVEASELCATAHMNKSILAVGYMERAHPVVWEAKQWASDEELHHAEFYCYWRATKKTYQLSVLDESSHAIDTALFVMGSAESAIRRGGVGVRANVSIRHRKATSEITMDMDAQPRRRITLCATNGSRFSKDYGTAAAEWTACYQAELESFLDGKPLCSGEDGLRVMEIMETVR